MAEFYTFKAFEMTREGTKERDLVVNLDNVITVEHPYGHLPDVMKVLLVDGTTFKATEYAKFMENFVWETRYMDLSARAN